MKWKKNEINAVSLDSLQTIIIIQFLENTIYGVIKTEKFPIAQLTNTISS